MADEIDLNGVNDVSDVDISRDDEGMPPIPQFQQRIKKMATAAGSQDVDLVQALIQARPDEVMPYEPCILPSRGIHYGWPIDTPINVRPMGIYVDRILNNQRWIQSGEAFDKIIESCCVLPNNLSTQDMLVGDRIFLMYYLRGITFGPMYDFTFTCPNKMCESQNTVQYDLQELGNTVVFSRAETGTEPFMIDLPVASEQFGRRFYVGVRFPRMRDITNTAKKNQVLQQVVAHPGMRRDRVNSFAVADVMADDMLDQLVVQIMSVTDTMKVREAVTKLHGNDRAVIRQWLKDNQPGIDASVAMQCRHCNQDVVIPLPISDAFFRPTKPGGVRA